MLRRWAMVFALPLAAGAHATAAPPDNPLAAVAVAVAAPATATATAGPAFGAREAAAPAPAGRPAEAAATTASADRSVRDRATTPASADRSFRARARATAPASADGSVRARAAAPPARGGDLVGASDAVPTRLLPARPRASASPAADTLRLPTFPRSLFEARHPRPGGADLRRIGAGVAPRVQLLPSGDRPGRVWALPAPGVALLPFLVSEGVFRDPPLTQWALLDADLLHAHARGRTLQAGGPDAADPRAEPGAPGARPAPGAPDARPAPDVGDPRPIPVDPDARPAPDEPDDPDEPDEPDDAVDVVAGFLSGHSDLGIRFRGRGEMGGDWTRFRPCDSGVAFACEPSLFPQLSPDLHFGIEIGGTVAERIHVDVDFDQARELTGSNNISIYYQGEEGELLQRLEVGDVTFDLPDSRFLTQGIPAGNFGFRATGQMGPVDVQAVWANQSGDLTTRTFRLSGAGEARAFVQEDTLVLDDAEYVRGQFFFLVDPREIFGFPHIDVLSLGAADAPSSLAPGAQPIQLYRFENAPIAGQQIEGYIQADATAERDGETVREAGWFRYLQEGVDYVLHPSGLWLVLRAPMRADEVLAVTYITAAGDTIGDYAPERIYNAGGRPALRLLRASGPNHQPDRPTWDLEMHQVYRISGSNEVDAGSVDLSISLGEASAGRTFARGPFGNEITFLRLFGLDENAPRERIDAPAIYRPGEDFFGEPAAVSGTFIVFPTLRPFQSPPPVPSESLSAEQSAAVLGASANRRIYEAGDPFERVNGGLFRLTVSYRILSDGALSTFSLGAFGIREGSERIHLDDRLLRPGLDYIVDYDLGMVTLLEPDLLLGAASSVEVRASFEQRAVFRAAPTSVFGMNARYALGERGSLNLIGLYQAERTVVRRPQLGVEPAAIALGGLNGQLRFDAPWMDRALAALPGLSGADGSSLTVGGEMALSLPNPNTERDVFLDDFDGTAELPLRLQSALWHLGSAPALADGAVELLPAALDETTVGSLAWQHTWVQEDFAGDSVGIFEGFVPQQDIDRQINVLGSGAREPGLRISFGLDQPPVFEELRWRSVTTVLGATGMDLSRTEFLDFYVADGDSATLVIDLGRVSEDAFFVDGQGRTSGVKPNGEPWGLGVLDQEANPMRGEIWSDASDAAGLWGEGCIAARARVYSVGDARANCTRGNGRPDTEDLNGNGVLDTEERAMRYVVRLDGSSPFLVRDRNATQTRFRLYRIPLRGPDAVNPGGLFSEGDWRGVQHLRITVAGGQRETLTIARMRLVGSRWVKRSLEGVVRGIAGDTLAAGGHVDVTPVSILTEGTAYQAPPGVLDELDDPGSLFSGQGIEFNEKSLGIRYRDIGPGDRVEIYNRFQQPRNFLTYRQARLWVVPRRGQWGPDGASFFLKVGSDPENFYLYRTRRAAASDPEAVAAADWMPEVVIDFEQWLRLRSQAEARLFEDPPGPGDPPIIEWSQDSTYAVVLRNRARAPNLAAVRELSMGVWNEGEVPTTGELWVNELRLGGAVRNAGGAGAFSVELAGADVVRTRVTFSDRGAYFRQLEGDPSYLQDRALDVHSTLELSRFAPTGWGVELPLDVQYTRASQDPLFLSRSDVSTDRLEGLRPTASTRTAVRLGYRKTTPLAHERLGVIVDGVDASVGFSRASGSTVTSESSADMFDAHVAYHHDPEPRELGVVPPLLRPMLAFLLPGFLEERVQDLRLRWSPERLSFATSYSWQESRIARYDEILVLPGAEAVLRNRSPREGLENRARVAFRPFQPLTGSLTFTSSRDLLDPRHTAYEVSLHPLLRAERRQLAGLDIGWETHRRIESQLGFRPELATWLVTDLSMSTIYGSDRNAGFASPRAEEEGSVSGLQRSGSGQRDVRASVSLDPGGLAQAALGEPDSAEGGLARGTRGVASAIEAMRVTWTDGVVSRFNREMFEPGAGFQLGWGDLDPFRLIGPGSQAVLTDRTGLSAGSAVRLPLRLRVSVDYARMETVTLDQRSDRETMTLLWPDVRAGFAELPLPDFVQPAIERVSVSSGYQRNVQETGFAGGAQRRWREDVRVPFDLSVRWTAGLVVAWRGFVGEGHGSDPTGDTERRELTQSVSVSSAFLPSRLRETLDRPLTASVQYSYAAQSDCRITAGSAACVPFVDQLNRSLGVNLDSRIAQLDVGLQASYTDRTSFVGQRPGSSQFQLGLWGQFVFSAGEAGR